MQQLYFRDQLIRYHRWMNSIQDSAGHPQEAVIRRRWKILEFFEQYDMSATQAAFSVSRSTVYLWRQKLQEGGGRLSSLAPGSRVPRTKRHWRVDSRVTAFILRYRQEHPGVGKGIIHPVLQTYGQREGISGPSESTVGRILEDFRQRGKLQEVREELRMNARTGKLVAKKQKARVRKLRRKGYRPQQPGDLVQMDSVFVSVEGIKRYLVTCKPDSDSPSSILAYPVMPPPIFSIAFSRWPRLPSAISKPIMAANSKKTFVWPYRNNSYRGSIIIPDIPKPMLTSNDLIGPSENSLFAGMTIS